MSNNPDNRPTLENLPVDMATAERFKADFERIFSPAAMQLQNPATLIAQGKLEARANANQQWEA